MFKKSIILYNICQVFFQKNSRSTDEISQHPHIFCINMQMKPIFFIIHIYTFIRLLIRFSYPFIPSADYFFIDILSKYCIISINLYLSQTVEAGVKATYELTESGRCWEVCGKRVVIMVRGGRSESCDVQAHVRCRGYAGTLLSARLLRRESRWHRGICIFVLGLCT